MYERDDPSPSAAQGKSFSPAVRLICGVLIGIGGILPGVSGSVLAVSLGLYRPMIEALAGFFKTPKRSFLFLLPIGVGAIAAVMLCAVALSTLMRTYEAEVLYLFLGLILGGVPSFVREANEEGFKKRYLIATALGALLASTLFFMETRVPGTGDAASFSPVSAMLAGAIVTAGALVPGLSTAVILMALGWYGPMMEAVAGVKLLTLLLMGAGAAVTACAMLKLTSWAIRRHHGWTYYATLGFLVVSAGLLVRMVTPFTMELRQLVRVLLFIGGGALALFSDRLLGGS